MNKRLRVVSYMVQPIVLVDDGEHLTPLQINSVSIAAVDWPDVAGIVERAMVELRQEIEGGDVSAVPEL